MTIPPLQKFILMELMYIKGERSGCRSNQQKVKLSISIIKILFIFIFLQGYTQTQKNIFECGALGNLGFINVGYDREVVTIDQVGVAIGTNIGYVPGSQEEESSAIPNFIHLNFGSSINYKIKSSKFGIGISFSKILIGYDDFNKREESNYNRLLADINYTYYFNINEIDKTGVKLSFVPILYDDGAEDLQNIPVGVSFIYEFH